MTIAILCTKYICTGIAQRPFIRKISGYFVFDQMTVAHAYTELNVRGKIQLVGMCVFYSLANSVLQLSSDFFFYWYFYHSYITSAFQPEPFIYHLLFISKNQQMFCVPRGCFQNRMSLHYTLCKRRHIPCTKTHIHIYAVSPFFGI